MATSFARTPDYQYNLKYNKNTLQTNVYSLYWIISRMVRGYSPIIGICGDQRDGKSWFAVYFAYIIMKFFKRPLDIKDHLVYDANGIDNVLLNLKLDVLILDEASYMYYKREWYKRPHIDLSKIIFVQGRKALAYIFVSPFINDVDKAFTKHFDIIIYVKRRGICKIYKMKKNHMAFSDRENKRIWWDDLRLNEKKMSQEFKELLEEYKRISEKEKDRIEREKDEEEGQNINKIFRGL